MRIDKEKPMSHHKGRIIAVLLMLVAALLTAGIAVNRSAHANPIAQTRSHASAPASLRLYVFDCGKLKISDTSVYGFAPNEVATTEMSVPCFLAAHPKGTLMWDAGVLPDNVLTSGGSVTRGNPGSSALATVSKPLKAQLAEVGYTPAEITYLALSHCHWDHVANANDFAGATWLVRQQERDAMFAQPASFARCLTPETFSALRNSKTVILKNDEYDVFGDGTVILKSAPGHTPGHQVLFLKLRKTGPIVLSGDLYHYPEERAQHKVPKTDFNREQTGASRDAIEAFLKKTGAQLWIQHDSTGNSKLKKAPAYYD
jgi:glyoxylase-like metal-dependent hydrolase (beta-lactamase superfamily II)